MTPFDPMASTNAGHRILDAGTIELDAPIRLNGAGASLHGAGFAGSGKTTLKRKRLQSGAIYAGPLLEVSRATHVRISHIEVDGGRFAPDAALADLRHPFSADRRANDFVGGFEAAGDWSPDVLVSEVEHVEITSLTVIDAVRIGLAIGPGCRDVAVRDSRFARAGDYGVWIGSGLGDSIPLPLAPSLAGRLPTRVSLTRCTIERCGASGLYIEGLDIDVADCTLLQNHWDAPYDDEGGQIAIDYKADKVSLRSCSILGGALVHRAGPSAPAQRTRLLGTFGIEASGSRLDFENLIIEGNSREAIQLVGARSVRLHGVHTRLVNNQLAARVGGERQDDGSPYEITVTTLAHLQAVGAVAGGLSLEQVVCEGGLIVWQHPSATNLRFDDLLVQNAVSTDGRPFVIRVEPAPDGASLRGTGWRVEGCLIIGVS